MTRQKESAPPGLRVAVSRNSNYGIMRIMDGRAMVLILIFGIVSISHAAFLRAAKKHQNSPESYRAKLWRIHSLVNGLLWLFLFSGVGIMQYVLPRSLLYPLWVQVSGVGSVIVGFCIAVYVFYLLGFDRAMGFRFFFPEKTEQITSGLYRYLKNPMYDGFLLIFIGLGFALGIAEDFYLAAASFILLNIMLARIENYEGIRNPF